MSYPGYLFNLGTRTAIGIADGGGTPTRIDVPVNFWVIASASGALSATVDILVSPDGDPAKEVSILPAPLALSGSNVVESYSEKVTLSGFYRFSVTAIGAGTTVNVQARV
ncbi:hypothetical protein [Chitinibacter sp. GC72]|uniref:hypothetical protein n=1 Tax=Chitinibacter sp. GC72 TaxID=1526917 RepID=UPI0012FB2686|nr:hypothetical protein [Chitinibacter sp. GC72]